MPNETTKHFRVYEIIEIVHYVEAADEARARDIADKRRDAIFQIPCMRDADIDGARITKVQEYDPEG